MKSVAAKDSPSPPDNLKRLSTATASIPPPVSYKLSS